MIPSHFPCAPLDVLEQETANRLSVFLKGVKARVSNKATLRKRLMIIRDQLPLVTALLDKDDLTEEAVAFWLDKTSSW